MYKSAQIGFLPITFLGLWPAMDHEPHSRHVPTNKMWRRAKTWLELRATTALVKQNEPISVPVINVHTKLAIHLFRLTVLSQWPVTVCPRRPPVTSHPTLHVLSTHNLEARPAEVGTPFRHLPMLI